MNRSVMLAIAGCAVLISSGCSQSASPLTPATVLEQAPAEPGGTRSGATGAAAISATGATNKLLAEVQQATVKYRKVENAIAAGYVLDPVCVSNPKGAMGIHAVNAGLIDQTLDHRTPEMLLYAPQKNGGVRLVGVEYFIPTSGPGAVITPTPSLFGRTFDGPMPGHAPGMPYHYDLHAWIWQQNPEGLFIPFNPNVRCD